MPSPQATKLDQIVGRNVRALRAYLGVSQAALASRMETYGHRWVQVTITEVEHGRRRIGLAEAVDLARCLEVTLDRLMQEEP